MVILRRQHIKKRGFAMVEVTVGLAIVVIAMLPLCFTINNDARLFHASYQRAVAMEIVDGEMEILAAGEWRGFPEGTRPYAIHAEAAANLPPGRFVLTRTGQHLRLEWSSVKKQGIGPVVREVTVK
jgi:hypothetical protein